jgi:hypothetical protein
MAGRGSERFEKRQRERARQQKAAAKRERRADKKVDDEDAVVGPTEDELLEQVRVLNEQHAEGLVDDEAFEERRAELFEQLGIE